MSLFNQDLEILFRFMFELELFKLWGQDERLGLAVEWFTPNFCTRTEAGAGGHKFTGLGLGGTKLHPRGPAAPQLGMVAAVAVLQYPASCSDLLHHGQPLHPSRTRPLVPLTFYLATTWMLQPELDENSIFGSYWWINVIMANLTSYPLNKRLGLIILTYKPWEIMQ